MFRKAACLGCLGTVIPVLAVVCGLLFAGDVFARRYATGQLSDRIAASVPDATGVRARIRSFPFVGRLLYNGRVTEVGAHIDRLAPVRGVVFTDLDIDLRDVVLDRNAFTTSRQVKLTRVGRGSVAVFVTQESLSAAAGRTVRINGGTVVVDVAGSRSVPANVSLLSPAAHALSLRMSPLPSLIVPLPDPKVLPCVPKVVVQEGRIGLSCTFTTIPAAFVIVSGTVAGP